MKPFPTDHKGEDAPLTVDIVNDELVIRIGIGTLAYAFDHMEENNPYDDNLRDFKQSWKVSDPMEFAKDVVGALVDEEEDGSHPLNRLLDQVCTAAADNGCLGIEECTDNKSAYTRDYEDEHKETP